MSAPSCARKELNNGLGLALGVEQVVGAAVMQSYRFPAGCAPSASAIAGKFSKVQSSDSAQQNPHQIVFMEPLHDDHDATVLLVIESPIQKRVPIPIRGRCPRAFWG